MPLPRIAASCLDIAILLLLWCAAVAHVNPLGDFPLNDDWAYGQNTRALAAENRLFFSDWPAMTLIAHTVWGALFCKIFGFSFTALRFSTLLLAMFGLAGFYRLLRWADLSRPLVWGLVLLLAFNPFWFVLANSYMTDVPFLAVLIWSVYFFLKTLEKPGARYLAAAVFFALWACFIRQLGLIAPGIFLLLFLYNQPFTGRNFLIAATPAGLCFAGVEFFTAWLKSTGQLPPAFTGLRHLWETFIHNPEAFSMATTRTGIALMTSALFLLPALSGNALKRLQYRWTAWMLLPAGLYCIRMAWPEFPHGNVFYNLGLGPRLLKDVFWGENAGFHLSGAPFSALKWLAAGSVGWLLFSVYPNRRMTVRQASLRRFSIGFSLVYLGFVCFNSLLIDRYLFPLMPFLLLFLGAGYGRFTWGGWLGLGLLAAFSISATHDYLAWNRARWAAMGRLDNQGITPSKIDGGFEYNGWHTTGPASQKSPGLKSWWFVQDDEWVVSFGPVYGYDPAFSVPFGRWLPPGRDSILASRRKSYVLQDSLQCDMERRTGDDTAFDAAIGGARPANGETRSGEKARSGQFSIKLNASAPFGATTALDTFHPFDRLEIDVWRFPADAEAGIVVSADDVEKAYFFEPANLVGQDSAGWGLLRMSVTLPEKVVGAKGKFYLWNPSQEQTVWFDDLKLRRLRVEQVYRSIR
ncbi:MAG: glycosyltransferase family 39 protein [Lewinellaceae bacterium]|nr:glycosyltransferase family 39 protein [Lewinellaceae bacterium]